MLSRHASSRKFITKYIPHSLQNVTNSTASQCLGSYHRYNHQLLMSTTTLGVSTSTIELPRVGLTSKQEFSELGLRSSLPPDSNSSPEPEKDKGQPPDISDQEWEIRTGRAIYILQETLSGFFNTGLVTSIDKTTGSPGASSSSTKLSSTASSAAHHLHLPISLANSEDEEPIYSHNVRLEYTPPVRLPSPFPRTLHIEGLTLYLASSAFVRHTMNALYSDLKVVPTKFIVNSPKSTDYVPDSSSSKGKGKLNREKSLSVRLNVTGTARVSGGPGEWEVNSTYIFSPLTGLIHQHVVNSIHPEPHQAVYDLLRTALGKAWNPPSPGAACTAGGGEDGKLKIKGGVGEL